MEKAGHVAIIVAGGSGTRMGSRLKKQYLSLDGVPVLSRTLKVFDTFKAIGEIVLVVPGDDLDYCRTTIVEPYRFVKPIHLARGGSTRQDSVFLGLKKAMTLESFNAGRIALIHDGVRPFVDHRTIEACIDKALECGAAIPGLKVTDTVKEVDDDRSIRKTLDRDVLYQAQTPQAFQTGLILKAFHNANETSFKGTDDASLVEHLGHKTYIVEGSKLNIKITTQQDLVLGELFLKQAGNSNKSLL